MQIIKHTLFAMQSRGGCKFLHLLTSLLLYVASQCKKMVCLLIKKGSCLNTYDEFPADRWKVAALFDALSGLVG